MVSNIFCSLINSEAIVTKLLAMTWYNPLFAFAAIICLWFIPGIIVRKIVEKRIIKAKAKKQEKALERLYPKKINPQGDSKLDA